MIASSNGIPFVVGLVEAHHLVDLHYLFVIPVSTKIDTFVLSNFSKFLTNRFRLDEVRLFFRLPDSMDDHMIYIHGLSVEYGAFRSTRSIGELPNLVYRLARQIEVQIECHLGQSTYGCNNPICLKDASFMAEIISTQNTIPPISEYF